MPFETPSLPVLISRTQSDLASEALRRSDAQVLARTLSGTAYGFYGYLDWIAEQILPDKADEETLERIAALRLNRPRNAAQPAEGSVSFSAAAGAVLDVDVVLQAGDGRMYRVTTSVTTIAGLNTTTIEAVEGGVLGNADAGLQLTLVQPVAGVTNAFTVIAPRLSGGIEKESLESLRARVIRSYRVIPHGGTVDDYETWALEFPGVTRAWCRGNYLGPGTVGLFVMRDKRSSTCAKPGAVAENQGLHRAVAACDSRVLRVAPDAESCAVQHPPRTRHNFGARSHHGKPEGSARTRGRAGRQAAYQPHSGGCQRRRRGNRSLVDCPVRRCDRYCQ